MNPGGYNLHGHTEVGDPAGVEMMAATAENITKDQQASSEKEVHDFAGPYMPKYAVLGPGGVVTSATLRDVLNGRGQGVQRHPGNAKYRTLVFVNKVSYYRIDMIRRRWDGVLSSSSFLPCIMGIDDRSKPLHSSGHVPIRFNVKKKFFHSHSYAAISTPVQ
jgi:hypothetical protein